MNISEAYMLKIPLNDYMELKYKSDEYDRIRRTYYKIDKEEDTCSAKEQLYVYLSGIFTCED